MFNRLNKTFLFNLFYLLILLQGNRIEVFVHQKSLLRQYQLEPSMGKVYHVKNLEVVPNKDDYKITNHPWKLKFNSTTFFE